MFQNAVLIHIECAVDLDLHRMLLELRPPIVIGDETARIRIVMHHDITQPGQDFRYDRGDFAAAGGAIPITENNFRLATIFTHRIDTL